MRALIIGASLAALAATPAAAAQFAFSFATTTALFGGPVSGSGVFTTADTPMTIGDRTAIAMTGITGTFNGSPITGPGGRPRATHQADRVAIAVRRTRPRARVG